MQIRAFQNRIRIKNLKATVMNQKEIKQMANWAEAQKATENKKHRENETTKQVKSNHLIEKLAFMQEEISYMRSGWGGQMKTLYEDLSEDEKQNDHYQAYKFLHMLYQNEEAKPKKPINLSN